MKESKCIPVFQLRENGIFNEKEIGSQVNILSQSINKDWSLLGILGQFVNIKSTERKKKLKWNIGAG